MIIETALPNFNGFYQSLWDSDDLDDEQFSCYKEENGLSIPDEVEHAMYEVAYNHINYAKRFNDIARDCVDYFNGTDFAKRLGLKARFKKVRSPMEYNFATDTIDIYLRINPESFNTIKQWCFVDYRDQFSDFIKDRFTSRSGFFSFHSNDIEQWEQDVSPEHENSFIQMLTMLEFLAQDRYGNRGEYPDCPDWMDCDHWLEAGDHNYYEYSYENYLSNYITIDDKEIHEKALALVDSRKARS